MINGYWVATVKDVDYFTGKRDVMEAIGMAVKKFNFAQEKAV